MTAEMLTMRDGARIYTERREPSENSNTRGVIQFVHGFGEHAGRYEDWAERFTSQGFAFVIHDQRGHGRTPGERGVAPGYGSFTDDLDEIRGHIGAWYPGKPVFLYGHSMGGNIALDYLLNRSQSRHAAAVVGSPWLRLYTPFPAVLRAAAAMLGKLSPRLVASTKLLLESLTHDQEIVKATGEDPLYHSKLSYRLFTEITRQGERAVADAPKLTLPTLLLRAGEELIVSPQAIEEFAAAARPETVSLRRYPGLYHELHNEITREEVFNDVLNFIRRYP